MSARACMYSAARHRAAGRGQAGMTLLEVLLAVSLLGFMLVIAWSTTSSVAEADQFFSKVQERNHEIRVAMTRMSKDLSAAYLSGNEDETLDNRRTWFVGKESSPVDELRFSTLGHMTLWANADESEQTLVSYHTTRNREDSTKTDLVRRESRRLSNEQWENEPAEVDLLLRDIEEVHFEYFDPVDNEWQEDWDSTGADAEQNRLPERVRITVTVRTGDRETVYSTQARPMMQEKLVF
ncbi:type II secretion system protein GspJ [Haliangium ochraceum]|uniref:Type II secretion system protein J n=1 Tax=Haliangium ochraceum (strain DSM 14365 / JCM 11303 / SMP-2) TaxID=502025 RepID=D0LLW9_HALO1|nr:type II secretion system protein GspJ [Haliangium ochraceum]ACY15147.1 putative general secretion pathway protein J [Haliangium ochraceum DSM 14365]